MNGAAILRYALTLLVNTLLLILENLVIPLVLDAITLLPLALLAFLTLYFFFPGLRPITGFFQCWAALFLVYLVKLVVPSQVTSQQVDAAVETQQTPRPRVQLPSLQQQLGEEATQENDEDEKTEEVPVVGKAEVSV